MAADDFSSLFTFLTVAEERSFTKAAKRLGITPSAVSHAMRDVEEEIGVRLLSRTTRSVAATISGEHLLRRIQPAFTEIREALGQVSGLRNKPAGRVRLLAPRLAVKTVLVPTIDQQKHSGRFHCL
jgi:DNA-binding transcriptional LysR family regulator